VKGRRGDGEILKIKDKSKSSFAKASEDEEI
jgi:hypothetical protein